ncbi:conserved proline-rich protein [Geosmithia morbida]|uniref:Conserved proline-rich protein n=1 Tax=Geosmithia morbida TaxID=1094350 RepID=A0A9P4Z1F3_9HYPO|nr:conserved proline-rich protein [Geosmithia morbida]KAF4124874.1 conserved proline-rich protein [Geosmithia morbida]
MSPSSTSPAPAAFSLFPNPNTSKPPPVVSNQMALGRRSESRERRTITPQGMRAQTPEAAYSSAPPRQARLTPPRTTQYRDSIQPDIPIGVQRPHQHELEHENEQEQPQPQPQQPYPPRAASPVLAAQQPSVRDSIAKLPLDDDGRPVLPLQQPGRQQVPQELPLRSIFPTYNPGLPLDQQDYAPTQKSPTRVPRAIISRQSYHQSGEQQQDAMQANSPTRSPMVVDDSGHRWARPRPQEPPAEPKVSSTEQLRGFWKVANGWKASASEGRVYCMKMAQDRDAPVYTMFSASRQPMYNIRLDPTSASARITVMRHDPNKPYKEATTTTSEGPSSPSASSSSSPLPSSSAGGGNGGGPSISTKGKNWIEALCATTEEESRKHQPQDGLVALLMPTSAARMAVERANDPAALAMAENECARLVWDDDSNNYFLVHPALATPFCITVDRAPAWSRVEYTLEHHESPRHLAKLTRDFTGGGWLEIDTGLASKIESFFIVDVAVTALTLVARDDEKNLPVGGAETFEPPPLAVPPPVAGAGAGATGHRSSSSLSRLVGAATGGIAKNGSSSSRNGNNKKSRMETFEIDVESQDDSFAKKPRVKVKEGIDRLPFILRIPAKIVKGLFKCTDTT